MSLEVSEVMKRIEAAMVEAMSQPLLPTAEPTREMNLAALEVAKKYRGPSLEVHALPEDIELGQLHISASYPRNWSEYKKMIEEMRTAMAAARERA